MRGSGSPPKGQPSTDVVLQQLNQCAPSPTSPSQSPPLSKRARTCSRQGDISNCTEQEPKLLTLTGDNGGQNQGHFTVGGHTSCDDPKAQVSCIEKLKHNAMEAGDACYLVSMTWVSKWRQYCRLLSSSAAMHSQRCLHLCPGAVNNTCLLHSETQQLLPNLVEDTDFVCLPEMAWYSLEHWYGKSETPLKRHVIHDGGYDKANIIEIYPPTFDIYVTLAASHGLGTVSGNSKPVISLSMDTPMEDAKHTLLAAHNLPQDTQVRLCWISKFIAATLDSLAVSNLILHQAPKMDPGDDTRTKIGDNCFNDSALMMHFSPDSEDWIYGSPQSSTTLPSIPSSPLCTFGSDFRKYTSFSDVPSSPVQLTNSSIFAANEDLDTLRHREGICGLVNLGNTCFMNSALQCLSNTPQLTRWFLANNHNQDLNRDNPLGMKGALAESYGNLVQLMWGNGTSLANPKQLKLIINQFSPLFSGYQQHDSQELLAFLLDGLHEDTNRIHDKTYKELSDFGDMLDQEVAKASWDYHKARNDSVIVDLFQGQFKSRLVCNVCEKVSVTFDPFMYLSLPLPTDTKRHTEIVFVPYDPYIFPQHMVLILDHDAAIVDLKAATANLAKVDDPSTLLVIELYKDNIYKVFQDFELVTSIQLVDTIYIYELPGPFSVDTGRSSPKPRAHLDTSSSNGGNNHSGGEWIVFPVYCSISMNDDEFRPGYQQFGGPLILAIQAKYASCVKNMYRLIAKHLERYTMVRLFREAYGLPGATKDPFTPPSPLSPLTDKTSTITERQHSKYIRHLEPISNLFSMKIFAANPDGYVSTNSLPHTDGDWQCILFEDMEDRYLHQKAEKTTVVGLASMGDIKDNSDENADAMRSDRVRHPPQQPSPSLSPSRTPSSPTPSPQATMIRQGEGILLEWDLRSAQDCFGIHITSPDISPLGTTTGTYTIDDTRWKDLSSTMDPPLITLMHCLDDFTKMEHLSEEDQWYCPQCKQHRPATKKFDLWRLPEILVIHLKRFDDTLHEKIQANIEFPLEALDMTERVLGATGDCRPVYDLYAVDNHVGSTDSGHYNAFAQNWHDEEWYCYDDAQVSPMDKEEVQTDSAYLLFYKRRC